MDDAFTSDLDFSYIFENISAALEAFAAISENVVAMVNDTIVPALERMTEIIKKLVEKINKTIKEIIKSYANIELSIPNSNITLDDCIHVPQGPPCTYITYVYGNQYNNCNIAYNQNCTDSKKTFDWKYWLALIIPTVIGIIDLLISFDVI